MSDELLRPALIEQHEAAGAKLVPFAGWLLPLQFEGTVAEHLAVRARAGVFDVSHLGTVWVEGADAVEVVGASLTNDPTTLEDGGSQYTLCCDEHGGIVDDLIIYRLGAQRLLAVPNAANTSAVVAALEGAAAGRNATIRDESSSWAILAVQGPDALGVLDRALGRVAPGLGVRTGELPYLGIVELELAGEVGCLARTGYTGEPGAELIVRGAVAPAVWEAVITEGAVPCGLGARDTLRLEMGYPLHGNDLCTDVHPYEARLGWAVKLDRGPFRGREALVAAKAAGPRRRLWGLKGTGRRPPRQGMAVVQDGREVGTVTSGSFSPVLGVGIGLAYLEGGAGPGHEVTVDVRGTPVAFEVVRPPFVDRDPKGPSGTRGG